MRYLGGKAKLASELSSIILKAAGDRPIKEFFCGGLNMTEVLQPVIANDLSKPMIELYQAMQNGWEPPDEVSEEEYHAAKTASGPIHGFVGHGCTWGAKWYGGYARNKRRASSCAESKRALTRQIAELKDTEFTCLDYKDVPTEEGDVIYCDPPYKGKTEGYAVKGFNHEEFWDYMRELSSFGCLIFVSEQTAPDDIKCIWKKTNNNDLNSKNMVEKLWILGT